LVRMPKYQIELRFMGCARLRWVATFVLMTFVSCRQAWAE
jgi:hypothetical protein